MGTCNKREEYTRGITIAYYYYGIGGYIWGVFFEGDYNITELQQCCFFLLLICVYVIMCYILKIRNVKGGVIMSDTTKAFGVTCIEMLQVELKLLNDKYKLGMVTGLELEEQTESILRYYLIHICK